MKGPQERSGPMQVMPGEGMVTEGRRVVGRLTEPQALSEGSRAVNRAIKGKTVLQEKGRLGQEDV